MPSAAELPVSAPKKAILLPQALPPEPSSSLPLEQAVPPATSASMATPPITRASFCLKARTLLRPWSEPPAADWHLRGRTNQTVVAGLGRDVIPPASGGVSPGKPG